MKPKLYLLAVISLVLVGCSPAEKASEPTSSSPSASNTASQSEEKAKCEGCTTEVAKAELASHDGKMQCKACIAAHNH